MPARARCREWESTNDGVATITWDVPGKSMNVLSLDGFKQLEAHVDAALADDAVKGVILTSGKPDFAAGMDLNILATGKGVVNEDPAKQVFDAINGMHAILRKIERAGMDPKTLKGGKPIVAALPGTALGIGLELPLACHRIFVADTRAPRSACQRSRSAFSPARAARRGWRASWARWARRRSCWKASWSTPSARNPPG